MAELRATPMSNPIMGLLADRLKKAQQFGAKPFGYNNPPVEMLMNLLGVPAVQQTMERMAYGEPLTTGSGMTTKPRPEAIEAAMTLLPASVGLAKATKGLPVGASIEKVGKFDIVKRDASDIFGEGAQRIRYIDPKSNGQIEVLARKDGTASVLSLEVPEKFRGQKIGESLQKQVLQDFPDMQGQVSSKAAATTAYRLGRRPVDMPDATLKDVHKMIDEDSSVNMISPKMQERISPSASYPQQEALDTAQRNATLPVEEGGLGLPKDNTPEMRAEAMGGIDAVHFSRRGGDYTELDSGKFAIAPFDAVGTHVGTPQAAMERFQNTVGYKVNNPNYALDELTGSSYPVKVLGNKPLLNQNGMPWGEDDLNTFLRQTGGHNYSDINGGKLTYQDLNADLRKKLFDEQGYTSIPYFNEVEGKGSVSYIVPPKNLRSQFAAFDPMRRNEPDILAGVLPLGLLADEEQRKKLYELMPSLLGQ